MWRRTLTLAIVMSVALLATGCGGGHKDHGTAAAKKASSTEATTTTVVPDASGLAGLSRRASSASATGAAATPTTLPDGRVVAMPPWFTVTVEKACVHAQDTQSFTVRGGMPGQLLIYDTAYYDEANQTGTSNYTNNYGSGSGKDKFDAEGNYHGTYVLAQAVPASTAYLSVATAKGGQLIQARTTYVIKPLTQPCS
jgi:hypothetical protein